MTYASYDFEYWLAASCWSMRRRTNLAQPAITGRNAGEQIHLGAALWTRGNVVLGFYGMWNGHPSNDRRLLTMDLGLAVSNDCLHYRRTTPRFSDCLGGGGWLAGTAARSQHRRFSGVNPGTRVCQCGGRKSFLVCAVAGTEQQWRARGALATRSTWLFPAVLRRAHGDRSRILSRRPLIEG